MKTSLLGFVPLIVAVDAFGVLPLLVLLQNSWNDPCGEGTLCEATEVAGSIAQGQNSHPSLSRVSSPPKVDGRLKKVI